jgi:hypothetical protein
MLTHTAGSIFMQVGFALGSTTSHKYTMTYWHCMQAMTYIVDG